MSKKSKSPFKSQKAPILASPPFRDIIDQACGRDRLYFERYPYIEYYVRKYIPGEFSSFVFPHNIHVIVQQISPGYRIRTPIRVERTGTIGDDYWNRLIEEDPQILEDELADEFET